MTECPARLHHLHLLTEEPERLLAFYGETLGMTPERLERDLWLCAAPGRRLLIGRGPTALGFAAYRLESQSGLAATRERLARHGVAAGPARSPLFGPEAFSVIDPDGNTVVFGHRDASPSASGTNHGLRARLQHVAVATDDPEKMLRFYTEGLGFVLSDQVLDGGALSACWLRTDREHHTLALFRTRQPGRRLDHYSYEVGEWALIRDWADHLAASGVPIVWGPGRHGPGNNLFIMIRDPAGNLVEFSAELEVIRGERSPAVWPQEARTFNRWGPAGLRT